MARKLYEQLRREAAALKIQKNFRAYVAQRSYLTVRSSAMILQTGLRAMVARNEFRLRKRTKAAIIAQVTSLFCYLSICSLFMLECRGSVMYNSSYRLHFTIEASVSQIRFKSSFLVVTEQLLTPKFLSTFHLQAQWRCHQAYSYYKKLQRAIIVSQCGWRCRVARRELRKLKMVGF